jgi:hypothetical protein
LDLSNFWMKIALTKQIGARRDGVRALLKERLAQKAMVRA